MKKLTERKSRLIFETSSQIRSVGKLRGIVIEPTPYAAIVRLSGTRQRTIVPWDAIYWLGVKLEVNRLRSHNAAEKMAKKEAKGRRHHG